jgi:transcriptional regulator with XRE-family HTH domain
MRSKRLSAAFAEVLKHERLAIGLSQEGLAHQAGLHRTYVGLVERGLRNPTIESAHSLATAMGVSLSSLIRQAEDRL